MEIGSPKMYILLSAYVDFINGNKIASLGFDRASSVPMAFFNLSIVLLSSVISLFSVIG